MAKFKRLILTELGNTTETFPLSMRNGTIKSGDSADLVNVYWEFFTEENEYEIKITNSDPLIENDVLRVGFDTQDSRDMPTTNEGKPFKIVATSIEATKRTWEMAKDEGVEVNHIQFEPIQEDGFDPNTTGKRAKLYKTFIKTQFPDAKIESGDWGVYKVTPNKV